MAEVEGVVVDVVTAEALIVEDAVDKLLGVDKTSGELVAGMSTKPVDCHDEL